MKLRKLTISNIASISEAQIDFTAEPLRNAPVFLICGETGSGKTTILDAICLALYNRTPRLSNAKASDDTKYSDNGQMIDIKKVNQLLKKGEAYGYASLDFEGADGKVYMAEWSCRLRTRARDLDSETWTVTDSTGRQAKATQSRMEEITGMDFDQFCRTSMLAQGEFTRFLKAEAKDKSDILEKITGTGIYAGIGKGIYDRYISAKREYETAETEVRSVSVMPEEEVSRCTGEIREIDKEIEAGYARITLIDSLMAAFDKIAAAGADIRQAEAAREKGKEKFSVLCAGIGYDRAALAGMQEELRAVTRELGAKEQSAPMLRSVQTIAENLRNVTRQEECIASLQTSEKEARAALEAAMKTHADKSAGMESAARELETLQKAVREAEDAKAGMQPEKTEKTRQDIVKWQKAVTGAESVLGGISADRRRIETERQALKELQSETARDRELLEAAAALAAKAEESFNEADMIYRRHRESTDKFVVELRERLRMTGAEECPVCHSKIHILPSEENDEEMLRQVLETREKKKEALEGARNEVTRLSTQISVKEKEIIRKSADLEKLGNEIVQRSVDFMKRYERLGLDKDEDPEVSVARFKERLEKTREANEKDLAGIRLRDMAIASARRKAEEYARDTYEPLRSGKEALEKEIIRIQGLIDTYAVSIRTAERSRDGSLANADRLILYRDWRDRWKADAEAFIKGLENEAEAYESLLRKRESIQEHIQTLSQTVETAESIREGIMKENPDFTAQDTAAAKFQGNAAISWGSLKESVENCNSRITAGINTISLNRGILDKAFSEDPGLPQDREALAECKASTLAQTQERSTAKGKLQSRLEENENSLRLLSGKAAVRDMKKGMFEKWSRLNGLFGGADGASFKKIAQSYIMQDILNHANRYLRRISGRYELTAQPGSLLILVKDNEDNIIRSGNTLSGGESFIVSLALALGLSGMAESSISVDTIFIDEGFGTLSHEWLGSVMNALEKLNTASGKHIGMITHMEELQKKIPVYIEVKKTDATSSRIHIRG